MRHIITTFTLAIILMLIASCKSKEEVNVTVDYECIFEQIDDNMDGIIDETERSLMTEYSLIEFTEQSEIESNLIGEWKLIGHGEGWVPTRSQPCGYITITVDELIFEYKDSQVDTITTYSWGIEQIKWPGGTYFRLKTVPENVDGLFLTSFCTDYMYGDATPRDGNMYLYQKME